MREVLALTPSCAEVDRPWFGDEVVPSELTNTMVALESLTFWALPITVIWSFSL